MASAADRAVRAQGGFAVTPNQVKAMIVAAHRAYDAQAKLGLVDDGVGFDAWRRATLHDVVGAAAPSSFRAVTQRDYAAVIKYFDDLAGGGGNKAATQDKAADERGRALWALAHTESELRAPFGGREGAQRYADALFAKIHGTDRYCASARQVWAVIFTLRNRAAKIREKTALGAHGASDGPLPPPHRSERFPAFSRGL